MERKEVNGVMEAEEVNDVIEKSGGVAAFFDLDGTLMPKPSMEKRFFWMLRYRRLIGIRNYFLWFAESLRLIPRGINQILHANKMYLRDVRVDEEVCGRDIPVCLRAKNEAGKNRERRRHARMPVPLFYPEAIERVAWHAERGHLIAIVSGTLEPLAEGAARSLEQELACRGTNASIEVCATRVETMGGKWTGRTIGEAMFGEAKARTIRKVAVERGLDLKRCFAYGDKATDRWLLETVGRPAAVNPSNDLVRIAHRNGWLVLRWGRGKLLTQRTQKSQRAGESGQGVQAVRAKSGFGI